MAVLSGVFVVVTLIQIIIWLVFPARLVWRRRRKQPEIPGAASVSVVICARNEAPNLKKNLPVILEQSYPADWEVVLVNDDSDDGTVLILNELSARYAHLKIVGVSPKTSPGKKYALTKGVEAARFDRIALTDADCMPAGPHWLSTMMQQAITPGIVLGYAPMNYERGWLNRWVRFETLYTALQYFSMANAGWPFMGVGRNMMWHKSLFAQAGGFSTHSHIAGGDDDLFVNQVADNNNTFICDAPETFMFSPAKTTLADWLKQKHRHLNAGLFYKKWHNLLLGGVAFTHAVHYGLAVILLIAYPGSTPMVLAGYLLRLAVVWPVYKTACLMFGERGISFFIPFLDAFLAIWFGSVAPVLMLTKNKKLAWK